MRPCRACQVAHLQASIAVSSQYQAAQSSNTSAPKPDLSLDALLRYFEWAQQQPEEEKGKLALELCHMLIIELANRDYPKASFPAQPSSPGRP